MHERIVNAVYLVVSFVLTDDHRLPEFNPQDPNHLLCRSRQASIALPLPPPPPRKKMLDEAR